MPDKRTGKSSAENFEAGLKLPVTYHVIVAFDRDEEGDWSYRSWHVVPRREDQSIGLSRRRWAGIARRGTLRRR
jgi:hypothetical protein